MQTGRPLTSYRGLQKDYCLEIQGKLPLLHNNKLIVKLVSIPFEVGDASVVSQMSLLSQ